MKRPWILVLPLAAVLGWCAAVRSARAPWPTRVQPAGEASPDALEAIVVRVTPEEASKAPPPEGEEPAVHGSVWTSEGRPVAGALVSGVLGGPVSTTGPEGSFSLPGDAPLALTVRAAGWGVVRVPAVRGVPVSVVLLPPGTVRFAFDGEVPREFRVRVERLDPEGSVRIPAALAEFGRGPWEIAGLAPGFYGARMASPDRQAAEAFFEVRSGDVREARFAAGPAGR